MSDATHHQKTRQAIAKLFRALDRAINEAEKAKAAREELRRLLGTDRQGASR